MAPSSVSRFLAGQERGECCLEEIPPMKGFRSLADSTHAPPNQSRTAKTQTLVLSIGPQRIVRRCFRSRFRYKCWVPGLRVAPDPILEIGPVNIWRVKVEGRRRSAIHILVIRMMWPATRVLAGPFKGRW
jgi:hypothetical protein